MTMVYSGLEGLINGINPLSAKHVYSRFRSALLAGLITVIGNEMCV